MLLTTKPGVKLGASVIIKSWKGLHYTGVLGWCGQLEVAFMGFTKQFNLIFAVYFHVWQDWYGVTREELRELRHFKLGTSPSALSFCRETRNHGRSTKYNTWVGRLPHDSNPRPKCHSQLLIASHLISQHNRMHYILQNSFCGHVFKIRHAKSNLGMALSWAIWRGARPA